MSFSGIYHFFWLIPFGALWVLLFIKQRQAVAWIKEYVSPRFAWQFTRYGRYTLPLHMVFILFMGISLVFAVTGPYKIGEIEKEQASGNVVLVIDASFSMAASDTIENPLTGVKPRNRLEQAKGVRPGPGGKNAGPEIRSAFF